MKKLVLLVLCLSLMSLGMAGCVTTKTDPAGNVTKIEVDKELIKTILAEVGPAAMPMIQQYTDMIAQYEAAKLERKTKAEMQKIQQKVDIAKQILESLQKKP